MPRDGRSIDQVALKGVGLTREIKYSHRYRVRSLGVPCGLYLLPLEFKYNSIFRCGLVPVRIDGAGRHLGEEKKSISEFLKGYDIMLHDNDGTIGFC
ncbi:hypothetical protein G5I_00106 [Acromyrmex echinatior]|uniref:Uncharacterized protein n=1 Tax=Acromyrmex echinatior TaxID=103372 RepID=F4W402_ACREC|nr:hypothetical protein G5I_00106 [Acromyrmex echinatior]